MYLADAPLAYNILPFANRPPFQPATAKGAGAYELERRFRALAIAAYIEEF